jgi:DnaJ-like protein
MANEAYWARYESVIDQQIRMAEERGDFADLPGKGKPLPGLDGPDDENWWIKSYIRRAELPSDALLPTPLQLRKEAERLPETVRDLPSEQAVLAAVAELNRRIAQWLRAPSGPAVPVRLVDADAVVQEWRQRRPSPPPAAGATPRERPRPWWRRGRRR